MNSTTPSVKNGQVAQAWDQVRQLLDTVGLPEENAKRVMVSDTDEPRIQRLNYKGEAQEQFALPTDIFERISAYSAPEKADPTAIPHKGVTPKKFKKAVKAAQKELAEPIRELRKRAGEIEKQMTEVLYGEKAGVFGKAREESQLLPEETTKLDALKAELEPIQEELAELSAVGRVLYALRGETSLDRFGVMFIGSLGFVPIKAVASVGAMWLPQLAPVDPVTGARENTQNMSFGAGLGIFGVSKVPGKKQLGYSVSPPWVFAIEHPVFGTNVGASISGVGFGGLAVLPSGNAAVELGKSFATPIPMVYLSAGFMIQHPILEPIVKPLIKPLAKGIGYVQDKFKEIGKGVAGVWGKLRSGLGFGGKEEDAEPVKAEAKEVAKESQKAPAAAPHAAAA